MEMSKYLIDFFYFNDNANRKLLSKIMLLPDKTPCIKLFSHLINCQYKWIARILKQPDAEAMSWWEAVYLLENLDGEWDKSFEPWPKYLSGLAEDDFLNELTFTWFDNEWWRATLQDIILQLNYHSIHHRAQMQMIIRQQGLTPDPLDYILTRYKKNEG
jgi:uncharacterized damage-inducible protein DinB